MHASHTSTRSAAASTSGDTSRSADATRSSSRPSSARRHMSSPRTISAPAPAPSSTVCGAPPRQRRPVRIQGVPVHRRLSRARRREGSACDVASGGELALALRARLRSSADLSARQREVPRRDPCGAAAPASATSCSTHSTTSNASSASPRRSALVQEVLIRVTPDVSGDTHRAISTGQADSKFGFGLGRGARGDRARQRRSAPATGRAALPHRVAAARRSNRSAPRSRARGARRVRRSTTSAAASASRTAPLRSRRRSPTTSRRSSAPSTAARARRNGC